MASSSGARSASRDQSDYHWDQNEDPDFQNLKAELWSVQKQRALLRLRSEIARERKLMKEDWKRLQEEEAGAAQLTGNTVQPPPRPIPVGPRYHRDPRDPRDLLPDPRPDPPRGPRQRPPVHPSRQRLMRSPRPTTSRPARGDFWKPSEDRYSPRSPGYHPPPDSAQSERAHSPVTVLGRTSPSYYASDGSPPLEDAAPADAFPQPDPPHQAAASRPPQSQPASSPSVGQKRTDSSHHSSLSDGSSSRLFKTETDSSVDSDSDSDSSGKPSTTDGAPQVGKKEDTPLQNPPAMKIDRLLSGGTRKDYHTLMSSLESHFNKHSRYFGSHAAKIQEGLRHLSLELRAQWNVRPANNKATWDQFCVFLKKQIRSTMQPNQAFQRFSNAQQRLNQTVESFAGYLQKLENELDRLVDDGEKLDRLYKAMLPEVVNQVGPPSPQVTVNEYLLRLQEAESNMPSRMAAVGRGRAPKRQRIE